MSYSTTLNQILYDTLQPNPNCEAAIYLDLQTGQQLGIYTYPRLRQEYTPEVMNTLTHLIIKMFSSKHMIHLTEHFRYSRNLLPDEEYFQELLINGLHDSYVCIRSELNKQHILVFVFNNQVVKGMMLREAKYFAQRIQDEVAKLDLTNHTEQESVVILDNPIPTTSQPESPSPHQHPSKTKSHHKNDILSALDRWLSN